LHAVATSGSYADLLNKPTTANIVENTNLYFTDARARASVSASGSLSYNSATGVFSYTTPSTSGISEGTNLYYTDARARGALSASTGISYNSTTGAISTTITQYTDTLARGAVSASGDLSYNSTTGVFSYTTPSTSGIVEGTNLYFTDARARASISVTGAGSYNSTTGVINIVGGVTSFNTRTGAITLSSADVTGALGFTPYNATNPSGYLTGITSSQVTTALGFTPYNATNPSGYISGITSGMVTTALGYTPYNSSNPSGYITSAALGSYLTSSTAASTYAPLAGTGASGTWGISISGNAATVTNGLYKVGTNAIPAAVVLNTTADNWMWQWASSGINDWYLGPTTANFGIGGSRLAISSSGSSPAAELSIERGTTKLLEILQANLLYKSNVILHAGNYNSYSPTLTGSGASGTWGISISGSAAQLGGYAPNQTGGANTIVQRDSNGYIQNSYFYTSGGGSERNGSSMGYFAGFLAGDYYIRSFTAAAAASAMGALTTGNYSSYALPLSGGTMTGQLNIRGDAPTIVFQDTNHRSAMVHVNSNVFYVLRGTGTDSTSYTTYNGYWPMELNLENNNATFGGSINAIGAITQAGNQVLHAGNYSSYALPISGGTLSGKLTISPSAGLDLYRLTFDADGTDSWQRAGSGNRHRFTTTGGADFIIGNGSGVATLNGNQLLHAGNYTSYSHSIATSDSRYVRRDTDGQYLRPFYQYSSNLTTESPATLRDQMGSSGGLRVDFMNPSYTGSGNWNHVITWSAYQFYNMYQLGGNYDGGTGTDLWVRSEANHGGTGWTAWRKLLNSANYTQYSPSLTGSGASGTWGINVTGSATSISTSGGYTLTGSGSEGSSSSWIGFPNGQGIWSPTNGAHLLPNNTGSYGSWYMYGTKNGWYGLHFGSGSTLMMNSNEVGFHREGSGWQMRWQSGTGYVHKGSSGGGTEAAILDASNYTNYVQQTYAGWDNYPGKDANTVVGGSWARSYFTYSNNAPLTGALAHFPAGGYDLQLNGSYGDGTGRLAFRNRNGDAGSFLSWREIIHAGNYTSYSPSLTGSGASGTWGINVTGTAYGLDVHTGRNNEVNKVVRTDANGYIQAGWINTTSGDSGFASRLTRIYASDDAYLRYLPLTDFKVSMGLSAKNSYSRRVDYSSDANYHVGSFGHSGYGANETFHGGSGFFDIWSGTNYPPSTSHIHGFNALHYTVNSLGSTGGNAYGIQVAGQYDQGGLLFSRGCSGGSFSAWRRQIDDNNYNSYSPTLTGGNASGTWGINITGRGYPRRSDGGDLNFYWAGQGGQPSWLWGGNDGANMYVYNPSNFSVSYASTCGTASRASRANGNMYIDDNYGNGIVGAYASTRYQGVFFMGDSYKMSADGTSLSNMYGIGWSHPNAGGAAGNLTDHGMLIINNGGFRCAISNSIVASGNITAYSDERLKTNWRDMPEDYVTRLAQVKVGIYDRIDEKEMSQVGVSAQSFQKLLPEAILTAKDEMQTLSVSYGNAALASSVELAKEVVDLKTRVAQLEALIEKLIKE
jgi:predicted RecA/RadA family phage recombinase